MDIHWDKINRFFNKIGYPLIFLGLCLLSYGLFLPFIGFYMDDWYLIWFKHVFGAIDLIKYFSLDRPLMAYFYIAANFILGGSEKPIVWQIFGVLTRWLSVVALWQMLNTLWPHAKRQNIYVALLAAVFPGFTQQWIAAIYSFFFTCLAGFFFSITLMLKAVRSPRRFWLYYVSSLLIMAYVIPASEFFFGLELIRILILWFEFNKDEFKLSQCFKKTSILALPYIVILALYFAWRVFVFKSVNHGVALSDWLTGGITKVIIQNLSYLYQAIITAIVRTWENLVNFSNYPSKGMQAFGILGLVIVVFIALFIWLRKMNSGSSEKEQIIEWQKRAPILGFISMILAILPFWAADLPIDNKFPYDRFLLAFLFGSCLIVVWLFEGFHFYNAKVVLLAVPFLVSVGMGYQIANANQYRMTWELQKRFLWQLDWRIPALEPKTLLLAYEMPETDYWSGPAISAFLNWTYADTVINRRIDYYFAVLNSGQKQEIPLLLPNRPVDSTYRTYSFEGNSSQAVFIYYSLDGCLRVLDSKLTPPETVLNKIAEPDVNLENPEVVDTMAGAKLTNLGLIINGNGGHPPLQVLGKEPQEGWCYYFEKAEFSRQEQDYHQVVALYTEATQHHLTPSNPTENYPFIDAFARTGNWATAEKITTALMPATSPALEVGLCYLWKTLATDFPGQKTAGRIIYDLNCPYY